MLRKSYSKKGSSCRVTFDLPADGKTNSVSLCGDFNDWEINPDYYMKVTPDSSHFWLTITDLEPQKEYIFQYFVDGAIRIADPYADKVSDPAWSTCPCPGETCSPRELIISRTPSQQPGAVPMHAPSVQLVRSSAIHIAAAP